MSTLSYAIRGTDGVVVRGQTAEEANSVIFLGQAKDVSLNLASDDIAGYMQQGEDLVIHLASGETITLQNYFQSVAGEERDLFISKNGAFQQVDLGEPVVDQYFAQYTEISTSEKWSAYDQLTFLDLERIEPVVAPLVAPVAGFIPGLLGVGGAAVVASTIDGGGDAGGNGGPIIPTVDDPDVSRIVGGTEDDSVTITGTGEAGSTVTVSIGSETVTTTVGDDGTYSASFDAAALPDDGVYASTVAVVAPDATTYDLDGPSVDIDTTPPDVGVQDGTVSTGDIVNEAEHRSGHVISGTGEAGAALTVEIDGTTHSTTVLADGTWSVTFASGEINTGEYSTAVTITSTDARGNVTTVTDQLEVDTIAPSVALNTVEGDNIINAAEATDGVVLSGTGEAGSALAITFGGVTQNVTVGSNGTWSSNFAASTVTAGTGNATVTLTATDAAGNSTTTTSTIAVDTEISADLNDNQVGGDDIANAAEVASGFALTGTADAGASVTVTLEGVTRTVTADNSGNWTANFGAGEIRSGTYDSTVTVSATDAAGNTITTTESLRVDTEIGLAFDSSQLGGDNTANAAEVQSGISLTGTADPGASVAVTMEGVTRTVTAAANGTWTASFTSAEIPQGTYNSLVTATATDAAGNSTTSSTTVAVDTQISAGLDSNQVGGDDIANAAEVASGFALTGTAEAGSTVVVKLENATRTVTADGSGNWTANFTSSDVRQGEYDAAVTVTATDAAGNSASSSGTLRVDTSTAINVNLSSGVFANPVNAAQMRGGVVLDGTTEANALVVVNVDGVVRRTTADSNGNWSVTYESGALREGTYTANATLSVTDAAGNTATANASFQVDTEITTPIVESVTFSGDEVTSLSLDTESQSYDIHSLNTDGTTTDVATTEIDLGGNETLFRLNSAAPDGAHLVVASTDSAGNKSDTLVVLDDNATNSGTLNHAQIGGFNIEGIELDYASDTSLTLTEAQIKNLSNTSDTLTIHGGSDDQITVNGAVKTNQTETIDGQLYDVYTVGNDGVTLVVDQDINVIV
ncbi:BapA prefix-like domain-containing protein [Shimia sp. R9_2]|uniref:Ig-like domain-containing protein n=1 Tax=Shimia sp. R9_2 TaxID=2821112 RepID=UPI001AD9C8AF|nr:Ig-like domain-containing protein [Shimia sp. R9_2]MBO9396789.1 BapA prefix-like domain-containing protein [Shimia sp. R9_2]